MNGDARRVDDPIDGEQVHHLEGGPSDRPHCHVHVNHIVKFQRLAVLHPCFQHRHVNALRSNFVIGVADMAEIFHPGFLEVGEVSAVVNDAHCIGFSKSNANAMREVICRTVGRRSIDILTTLDRIVLV